MTLAADEFQILNTYDRNFLCFTQGFLYLSDSNQIVESCGLYGKSKIVKYSLDKLSLNEKDAQSLTVVTNPTSEFAEGLTFMNDRYYQLTWQNNSMHVYDKNFNKIEDVQLPNDMKRSGWGLANDGTYLYATNGGSILFKLDPSNNYKLVSKINVLDSQGRGVSNINECEIVGSYIYCNVFQTAFIYKIDYNTGNAAKVYNMSTLYIIECNFFNLDLYYWI